jgi:ribonuclease Z
VFSVTILGNNSAVPAHHRHPTSQVFQTSEHTFLIDCGEGTQMQMNAYKIRRSKINHIFISHLHGDHYFGLIGLITSLGLNHRTADLHIYSSENLRQILEMQLNVAKATLPYQICFHVLNHEEIIFEDATISVECFGVDHRIECWGFLFREKKNLRKIDPEKVAKYDIPNSFFESLHAGTDYVAPDGVVVPNSELTIPASSPRSYAYCADTRYFEPVIKKVRGVDLLYHESTYLQEQEDKAHSRFHSTALEAGRIAAKAGVKKLILGHFSSMYEDLTVFKEEASTAFENVEIAEEGACFFI